MIRTINNSRNLLIEDHYKIILRMCVASDICWLSILKRNIGVLMWNTKYCDWTVRHRILARILYPTLSQISFHSTKL